MTDIGRNLPVNFEPQLSAKEVINRMSPFGRIKKPEGKPHLSE